MTTTISPNDPGLVNLSSLGAATAALIFSDEVQRSDFIFQPGDPTEASLLQQQFSIPLTDVVLDLLKLTEEDLPLPEGIDLDLISLDGTYQLGIIGEDLSEQSFNAAGDPTDRFGGQVDAITFSWSLTLDVNVEFELPDVKSLIAEADDALGALGDTFTSSDLDALESIDLADLGLGKGDPIGIAQAFLFQGGSSINVSNLQFTNMERLYNFLTTQSFAPFFQSIAPFFIVQGSDLEPDGLADILITGVQGDNIAAGNGNDFVFGGDGADNILGDNPDLPDSGNNNDTLIGGSGNDGIFGETGNDLIFGNLGQDNLNGQAGIDTVFGGKGDDFINGQEEGDKLLGGSGNDFIVGAGGEDIIYGGLGNDEAFGDGGGAGASAGDDTMDGGAGDDRLLGQAGDDVIDGGLGNDSLTGGNGDDTVTGGFRDDRLFGNAGEDLLYGDFALKVIDVLPIIEIGGFIVNSIAGLFLDGFTSEDVEAEFGEELQVSTLSVFDGVSDVAEDIAIFVNEFVGGNDVLSGGIGDDMLFGGAFNDFIEGGVGADYVEGGAGTDQIIVTGSDTIWTDINPDKYDTDSELVHVLDEPKFQFFDNLIFRTDTETDTPWWAPEAGENQVNVDVWDFTLGQDRGFVADFAEEEVTVINFGSGVRLDFDSQGLGDVPIGVSAGINLFGVSFEDFVLGEDFVVPFG